MSMESIWLAFPSCEARRSHSVGKHHLHIFSYIHHFYLMDDFMTSEPFLVKKRLEGIKCIFNISNKAGWR